jgi:uncharacterized protein (DUF2236 family)
MLGVPPDDLPDRLTDLREWMAGMISDGRVCVTPPAREIARTVLRPLAWVPAIAWDAAHLVSISTLPDPLRRQYGIAWSPARERGMDRIATVVRAMLPFVPPALRFAPQARHAQRRARRSTLAHR